MKSVIHLVANKEESIQRTQYGKANNVSAFTEDKDELQKLRLEVHSLREELMESRRELERHIVLLANARVRELELRATLCRT